MPPEINRLGDHLELETPDRQLARRQSHQRSHRGRQQFDQTRQTRRLRIHQLRQLPDPSPALRRQTQLGPPRHTHSPLKSEEPVNQSVARSRQPLHLTLAASSRSFTERAFACHEQSDWEGLIVNAGIAIELLAKSVLVSINPLLISDPKDERSLLILAQGEPRGNVLTSLRTVGADTAIARLQKLGVSFDEFGDDLRALRIARNAVVHVGVYDKTDVDRVFDAWIRSMVKLCMKGEYSIRLIFGKNSDLVDLQLRDYENAVDALLEQRKAAAERRWRTWKYDLSEIDIKRRSDTLRAEMESANAVDPRIQCTNCLVCSLPAYLYGDLDLDVDIDYEGGDAYVTGVYFDFVPIGLRCPTCELNLDSRQLISRSAVLQDWELDDGDRERWEEEIRASWKDEHDLELW